MLSPLGRLSCESTLSNLTGPGNDPQTFCADSDVFNHDACKTVYQLLTLKCSGAIYCSLLVLYDIVETREQGWRPRDLNFKLSVSRLGEKFGSRSRSNWISVSKQKLVSRLLLLVPHFSSLHHVCEESRASMLITELKPISIASFSIRL